MKFAKVYLPLAAVVLVSVVTTSQAAVAYTNLPATPPFYNPSTGSTIFGLVQDPNQMLMSGSIAMSFVPTVTGTISAVTLGITVQAEGPGGTTDGNVNVFLAQGPMELTPGVFNFTSIVALGSAMTTAPVGDPTTPLTSVLPPTPLPIFSGNTYYLLLEPGTPFTSILWNENITGAMSDYYASSDMGATFIHGGVFNSDALQVDVDVTAIPEPSTWITGAMMVGVVGWLGRRRLAFAKAKR